VVSYASFLYSSYSSTVLDVRPKWEFSQALRVFQAEFKAKNIKFHYAMDVSYEDQEVDIVVADVNRMKQGNNSPLCSMLY
jgi:hypothetical protein